MPVTFGKDIKPGATVHLKTPFVHGLAADLIGILRDIIALKNKYANHGNKTQKVPHTTMGHGDCRRKTGI
jgi:hypothetical protein